ncbi:CopD family protein [Micromonospora sp. GCM10011542]|uniref:CopD family protein n=1 Tax=Micromonospora sp. GCM10011542 TaxID=3317337 RepID=UPI00360C60C1
MIGSLPVDLALRSITLGSALLLLGALPVSMLFLRSLGAAAQRDVPRALVRLRRILRCAAVAVGASAVLTVWHLADQLQAASGTNDAGDTVRQALSSQVGSWTAMRVPAAVVLWFVVATALTAPSSAGWLSWAAPAVVLAVSLPMTSHAGVTNALGIVVDLLHLASGAVWLAGVLALAVVVPLALRAGTADRRRQVLLSCAAAFSRLAVLAVAIAVVTGVAQPFVADVDLRSLPGTTWGAAAVTKLLLVLVIVAAGVANHYVLIGRLDRARSRARLDDRATALLGVVSLEVVLGVATVLAAALLVSAPPP